MNRFKAFVIHLSISAIIFAALAALVLGIWYPDFLFRTDGGWQGIRILVLVDLVLGPLLTLIVFKVGKPGLKLDLTMIAGFQLFCLVAGTYVVYDQRPIAVVYVDGHFYSMSKDDYREVGVEPPDIGILTQAAWYMVDMPADVFEQGHIREDMLKARRPLRTLVERYTDFDPNRLDLDDAVEPGYLTDLDRETKELALWQTDHEGDPTAYAFYFYGARYGYAFIGFDKATREFAGLLEVNART